MASKSGGMLAPVVMRALRSAINGAPNMIRAAKAKINEFAKPLNQELAHVPVRVVARQPIHPAAILRQAKRNAANAVRWSSTKSYTRQVNNAVRRYISTARIELQGGISSVDRAAFNSSTIGRAFTHTPSYRTPFTSTLRPNLTGGTLPRTAGGYAIPGSGRIGGQRFFSHMPASQAQVVQNVSQAMRAFWLGGQRAQFDGLGADGKQRWRAVSALQDGAGRKLAMHVGKQNVPGSFIDFKIAPTVTALSPLAAAAAAQSTGASLNEEGFLDVLSVDFARQLKDLAAVMGDLKKLALLGDLPVSMNQGNVLRVRFPGVDAESVHRLCEDLGVQRGIIRQDSDFDTRLEEHELKFPFAPDAHTPEPVLSSPGGSLRSHQSDLSSLSEDEEYAMFEHTDAVNPWLSPIHTEEGYESMSPPLSSSDQHVSAASYEGLEGVYKFLEECDRARDQFQTR